MIKSILIISLIFLTTSFVGENLAEAKPFKRALIISGGGMVPGLGLGYLAGAEDMRTKPDIIIATCGASMPTALYDRMGDARSSLAFMKSETFFKAVSRIYIHTSNLLTLQSKFDEFREKPDLIPDFFSDYVLYVPSYFHPIIADHHFVAQENKPRVIILSARAHFHKSDVGQPKKDLMKFTQVFMTDKDTASYLKGYQSPLISKYPDSNIEAQTETLTYMSAEVAVRASISDPVLMEPLQYGLDYYFTGASDLYPIELAQTLADEVIATYPMAVFTDYEELAFKSTFGISQRQRALDVIKTPNVKWIDQTEFPPSASFDPYPNFLSLSNGMPEDLEDFGAGIDRQFEFARYRMIELLTLKQNQGPYLKHIRAPIDKPTNTKRNGMGSSSIF
jgi:hypothetical protein